MTDGAPPEPPARVGDAARARRDDLGGPRVSTRIVFARYLTKTDNGMVAAAVIVIALGLRV